MIMKYKEKEPCIAATCFIANNSTIIGNVTLHAHASVWFGTVIRGDKDYIEIGEYTNIQDNCTLHTDPGHHLILKNHVTVGHNAILHGASIDSETLIGMGAIVLNGAKIGKHCIIGAGALVIENQIIPDGSVAVGSPAKILKECTSEQMEHILQNAYHYAELASEYMKMED